jgi:hypothetical protein
MAQEITAANPVLSQFEISRKWRTKYPKSRTIKTAVIAIKRVHLKGKLNAMPVFST